MDHPLDLPLHALACDRHPPDAEALSFAWEDGTVDRLTFGDVALASRDVARQLAEAGVEAPMRVAVVLPQSPLAPVVHLALSRLGAVAVPLSPLLGPDALAPRLAASGAVLAVAHHARADAVREAAPSLALWRSDGRVPRPPSDAARFEPPAQGRVVQLGRERLVEKPMCMIFTSGTSAAPKAALLPHRVVAGRMPAFALAHPGFPTQGDRFWSPADWAWIGGLHDSLFAPWAAGAPVFAYERRGPFDAARAGALLREHGVRNAFLPPTALRLWMRSGAPGVPLRTLHTAGEPLPAAARAWAAGAFGVAPREVYGLTECAFVLVDDEGRGGATGRPAPGAEVKVLTPTLAEAAPGATGELCVRKGAPTMMLGYVVDDCIRLPLDADGWFHTGDLATRVEDGRITIVGRLDDVVKVSGYRVSPVEVEDALARHPGVAECAVVGVPDDVRGHALVAFVVAAEGATAGDALARELRAAVRERLAAHEVPREVRFVDALPRTATGKLLRRELRRAAEPA